MKKFPEVIFVSVCTFMVIFVSGCGQSSNTEKIAQAESIDVDLTTMSATIVYSQVYDMMMNPENYVGKTVKMNGTFVSYHDDYTGNDYYSCIIEDAAACCAQGIEFVLSDKSGQSYPNEDENITVSGVFATYMEGEDMYCTLRDAILLF